MELVAIGHVQSPLTDRASAPKQGDEGAPEAWVVFEPNMGEALSGWRRATTSCCSRGWTGPTVPS